jgi:RimJ/RimL family protein N-acetyltransferase
MALNGEPSTRRWLPSHVYASLDEAVAALRFLISCYAAPGDPRLGPYVLAVGHSNSGQLLGHVGFSPLDSEVEVSYAVAETARGRGYAVEALVHACGWIAETYDVTRVVAITASENVASRRTLERASFAHERDQVRSFQASKRSVSCYRWHASSVLRSWNHWSQ